MLTQKELMEAVEKDNYKILIDYPQSAQSEKEKQELKTILNSSAEQEISPFAKAVHKYPQNPKQWGSIIITMIMAGADVYAQYPNSDYTILERLHIYTDETYFEGLCSTLFTIAMIEGNIRNLYSLIARNSHLIILLRVRQKNELYSLLLQQIHLIPDTASKDYLATNKECFIGKEYIGYTRLAIENIFPILLDLINLLHPDQFTSTIDKRKWYILLFSLNSRALCIASRRPLASEKRKEFFKDLFNKKAFSIHSSTILPSIDKYFVGVFQKLEKHGLIELLENKHQINLLGDIQKQIRFLYSPLRLAVVELLSTHQLRNKKNQQPSLESNPAASSTPSTILSPPSITQNTAVTKNEILSHAEIILIRKILSLANRRDSVGLEKTFDKKTLDQLVPLINTYHSSALSRDTSFDLSSNVVQGEEDAPKENADALDESQSKYLYESILGKLPPTPQANYGFYQKLYTTRKNEYENLETVADEFRYAIHHSLTVRIKDLIINAYFALDESLIHEALFSAIAKNNIDVVTTIIEAKPFLLFSCVNAEKKTPWDLLVTLISTPDSQLLITVLTVFKTAFNISGKTLLPLAAAFGLVEIIDFLLIKHGKELLTTDDLELSFQFAQDHHYYDILTKLIKKEAHFNKIKNFIKTDSFAKFLFEASFTIIDIEGLKYFYHLFTAEFKKFFIQESFNLTRWINKQKTAENELTPESRWEMLIIQLKYRAANIKTAVKESINTDIFDQIDKLYATLFARKASSTESIHLVTTPTQPELAEITHTPIKPISPNCSQEQVDLNKPHLFLGIIIKYIDFNDDQLAKQLIKQLYKTLENRIDHKLLIANKNKISLALEKIINNIKQGKIKWITSLRWLIKLSIKIKIILPEQYHDYLSRLQFLLSEDDFKQIQSDLLHKKTKLSFIDNVTVQEIIKTTSTKSAVETSNLDLKRRSNDHLVNDQQLRPTPSVTALKIAEASRITTEQRMSQRAKLPPEKWQKVYRDTFRNQHALGLTAIGYLEEYQKQLRELQQTPPEKKLLFAVKKNLHKVVENLLHDKSHSFKDWDNEILTAFNTAVGNNNLAHCAKAFIDHLDPKDWQILTKDNKDQLSPLALAEKNDNWIVQKAILTKTIAAELYPIHYEIHLAIIWQLPKTLRNCIIETQITLDNTAYLLSTFELAIDHQFIAGILCFIELNKSCLESIDPPYLKKLQFIYSKILNETNDIEKFKIIFNHLHHLNAYYSTKLSTLSYDMRLQLTLLNCEMLLILQRFIKLTRPADSFVHNLIETINLNHEMTTIENHFKQLKLQLPQLLTTENDTDKINATPVISDLSSARIITIFVQAVIYGIESQLTSLLTQLSEAVANNTSVITNTYATAIICAIELDFFDVFTKLIGACLQSETFITVIQSCLNYILAHHRYHYLEYLLQDKHRSQMYLNLVDHDEFFIVISNEISHTNSISALFVIHDKINGIYEPFLSSKKDSFHHLKKPSILIQQLKERLTIVAGPSLFKKHEFERLIAFLYTDKVNTTHFYTCLLQALQHCQTESHFLFINDQLQQWLQLLIAKNNLNTFHLIQIIQTRITIQEKMTELHLKYRSSPHQDSTVDDTILTDLLLPINASEKIFFYNNKIHTSVLRKTTSDNSFKAATISYPDKSLQFYAEILNKNSYELLEAASTLLSLAYDDQKPLNFKQNLLCGKITDLLRKNTKLCYHHHETIKRTLPILIKFSLTVFIYHNLNYTQTHKIQDLKFDRHLLSKSFKQDASSEMDTKIQSLSDNKTSPDNPTLDEVISFLGTNYVLHVKTIPYLENIWQELLERIEQNVQSLVDNALINKDLISIIFIDENSADQLWQERFANRFGTPPVNEQKEPQFYQKHYKLTALEFNSLANLKAQFDYCIERELIISLHYLIERSAHVLSYPQLQSAFLLAIKIKATRTILLLLTFLNSFEMFTQKISQGNTIWQVINSFPDSDFIAAAALLLDKMRYYLANNYTADASDPSEINTLTLAICFGMNRLTFNLLTTTKSFSENEIKSAFQTGIYLRNYDCVTALIEQYCQKYPQAFKISRADLYTYLNDEIATCDTKIMLEKLRSKATKHYNHLRQLPPRDTLFSDKDPEWQIIIDGISRREKEIEQAEAVLNVFGQKNNIGQLAEQSFKSTSAT